MSDIAQELASQPECWERAVALLPEARPGLPAREDRVLAVGCGTSLHVAQVYAALRAEAHQGETDAFPASEVPPGRMYDRVLAISRSGTTTEVLRFLEATSTPSTAIVGDAGTPIAETASSVVALGFADERSVVQTRFATSALALLRASVGGDLSEAIADARAALADPLPVDPADVRHFVSLGRGWTVGLANEAALKVREASRTFAESYPAMEYRHGPISVANQGTLVWAFRGVEADVLDDVRETGATVIAGERDPMAELVMIQRLAVALAESKGLDPDHPRHLSRSVVLSGGGE